MCFLGQMLTFIMLARLATLCPEPVLQRVDRLIEPLRATCTAKVSPALPCAAWALESLSGLVSHHSLYHVHYSGKLAIAPEGSRCPGLQAGLPGCDSFIKYFLGVGLGEGPRIQCYTC